MSLREKLERDINHLQGVLQLLERHPDLAEVGPGVYVSESIGPQVTGYTVDATLNAVRVEVYCWGNADTRIFLSPRRLLVASKMAGGWDVARSWALSLLSKGVPVQIVMAVRRQVEHVLQ